MTEQEIFTKNLILSTEFDRYLMENPDFAEKIPLNAQIILLPNDDKELCKINIDMAKEQHEKDQSIIYIHVGLVAQQISRLTDVKIELVSV
jgi:hypothetical protein